MANNYSTDSTDQNGKPLGNNTWISRNVAGSMGGAIPRSDLQNKVQDLNAHVGAFVQTFDQQTRKSNPEFERTLNGLFDSKANKAQNFQKIQDAVNASTPVINSTFGGMIPDRKAATMHQLGMTDFLPSATQQTGAPPNPQQGPPPKVNYIQQRMGPNNHMIGYDGQTWRDVQSGNPLTPVQQ